MSEVLFQESKRLKSPGFGRAKKHPTRIDMTPMVDLGFLLITFFIYTTSISEPNTMSLITPKEAGHPTPIKESGALTLLPGENEKVYYYEGMLVPANLRAVSLKEIRQVIIDKKRQTPADDLFVIIKPSRSANYRIVVDILDEMVISDIKRYALVKITGQEESLIK